MVTTTGERPQPTLQYALYSGIALIVVSMLFLSREQVSGSFLVQAVTVLAAPAFFYGVGALVYRYLYAPLAAPGIIATGAWLLGVGLIHLYDKRILLPDALQPYYWLSASLLAGTIITLTGHRVSIWLITPLVPLTQINLMWSLMTALGIEVQWMPALSFALVLLWWEIPLRSERWTSIYRVSGVFLMLFLLFFSLWLPNPTGNTLMTTWAAGALLVAFLGFRHGWARTGPLTITMLVCASALGLPREWWAVAWLGLAAVTVIFIERMSICAERKGDRVKDAKTVEISKALAVVLCGISAFLSQGGPLVGIVMNPIVGLLVMLGAGALLVWLGWRRGLRLGTHLDLWLMAAAWGKLYFIAAATSNSFGLWLALFATVALLVERLLASKRKHKGANTLFETVVQWPFADLVIGLSAIILIWTAIHISSTPVWITTVTLAVTIGAWTAAGLIYRLPALLHVALWIAPIPYALLLILANPAIWTLPLIGFAWQVLGVALLLFGHSQHRYRPAVRAPFFIVGYALLGGGLLLAARNAMLAPFGLGLIVIVCAVTSVLAILDFHPLWRMFVERFVSSEKRPYAFRAIYHVFLLLTAWLSVIWLQLMFGYTGMPLPQQGVFFVVFASLWFLIGRILAQIPGVIGWPVSSAGWMLWLIGLLLVFFSPAEAIITMILGLLLSGDAVFRARSVQWIPVFILQLFFSMIQVGRMLALPTDLLLLLVAAGSSAAGMMTERRNLRAGRLAAVTGAALVVAFTAVRPNAPALLVVAGLGALAAIQYRDWRWIGVVYASAALLVIRSYVAVTAELLLTAGIAQFVIGAELALRLRPRGYRTLSGFLKTGDWATSFLWAGSLCLAGALLRAPIHITMGGIPTASLAITLLLGIYSARLHVRQFPYFTMLASAPLLTALVVALLADRILVIGQVLTTIVTLLALAALSIRFAGIRALRSMRPFRRARWLVWWLRPLLLAAIAFSFLSGMLSLFVASSPNIPAVHKGASAVTLIACFALYYLQTRQPMWLWAALASGVIGWLGLAGTFGLRGELWYSLPIGIALLALARRVRGGNTLMECGGVFALLAGAALQIDRRALFSVDTALFALHLIGLLVYGYLGGRRIPFAAAGGLMALGLITAVASVNMWLLPLAGGVLLLAGALFAEVKGTLLERWATYWMLRWKQWK